MLQCDVFGIINVKAIFYRKFMSKHLILIIGVFSVFVNRVANGTTICHPIKDGQICTASGEFESQTAGVGPLIESTTNKN